MKGRPWYKKIIFSSWFLALIPAVILLLFIRPAGSKYLLETERAKNIYFQLFYTDLNSDSISEVVSSFRGSSYDFLAIKTNDSKIYDQWNLVDSLDVNISGLFTGNFDSDKFSEIFIFTYSNDSLFLNINEVLDPEGFRKDHIFITRIGKFRGKVESYFCKTGFFDKDNDGYMELYFNLSSAFDLGPRRIFSYNLLSGRTDTSPPANIVPYITEMTDADNDKLPEIYGRLSASGNFRSNVPYSDSSTWLMVFNDQLEFEFPPVEYKGFGNSLDIQPYNMSYAVLHWAGGTDTSAISSRLMLFSTEGKELKYRLLSELGYAEQAGLLVFDNYDGDNLLLLGKKITLLNGNLEPLKVYKVPFRSEFIPRRVDINNDGEDEMLLYSELEQRLIALNQKLEPMAETRLVTLPAYSWKISYQKTMEGYRTVIQAGDSVHYLSFGPNKYFYFSFLRYPGIYFAFILFIALVRRINTLQVVQKEKINQRLLTLQLHGIKAQLDPHFTFNTLNSVASLIYLKDHETAYDYMNKFTQLLRVMLNDAEKVYRTLDEEIQFVTTYFELEKLRFGDKFRYKVETGEGITGKENVPKLVLHTFAENAIKHGIIQKAEGGTVFIKIYKEKNSLRIFVDDDGIGRRQAGLQSQNSAGKGLKLTGEFYEILNQMNDRPVSYKIRDLYDDQGKSVGTSVEIVVPLILGVLSKK